MLLACCDKSTIVALEAIKGLAGASFPTAATIAAADGSNGGSATRRPPVLPDEHVEADVRVKCSMGWQLLLAHAGDEAPEYREPAAAAGPAAGATGKQSTMARCVSVCSGALPVGMLFSCLGVGLRSLPWQPLHPYPAVVCYVANAIISHMPPAWCAVFCVSCRVQQAAQQTPGLRHLTGLSSDAAAGRTGGSVAPTSTTGSIGGGSMTLFAAVASRLLNCLNQTSHAAICRCVGARWQ